jgi:hypothetical protein
VEGDWDTARAYVTALFGQEGIRRFLSGDSGVEVMLLVIQGVDRLYTFGVRSGKVYVDM